MENKKVKKLTHFLKEASEPKAMNLHKVFVVITFGYWGRGASIEEAAKNCWDAGSPKNLDVVGRVLVTKSPDIKSQEDFQKEVYVDEYGSIHYPDCENTECIRIISPSDGHRVKLSALLVLPQFSDKQLAVLKKEFAKIIEDVNDNREDDDGVWFYLKKGYSVEGNHKTDDCHAVHEDTSDAALKALSRVKECKCDDFKKQ
jgi:hypothetical protein